MFTRTLPQLIHLFSSKQIKSKMKRLFTILLIFVSVNTFGQIFVTQPFVKGNPLDNSINAYAENINGGFHAVSDYHGRDSLSTFFTKTLRRGMYVHVYNPGIVDSLYQWTGTSWNGVLGPGYTKAHIDSIVNGLIPLAKLNVLGNSGNTVTKTAGAGAGSALLVNTYAPSGAVTEISNMQATNSSTLEYNQWHIRGFTPTSGAGNNDFYEDLPGVDGTIINTATLNGGYYPAWFDGSFKLTTLTSAKKSKQLFYDPATHLVSYGDTTGTGGSGGGGTPANPTASIGVTTVNGTATTYMRSDAAPKADTSLLQTVANFFPKGDTRYLKTSIATSNYVPYSGASTNVDLGSFKIKAANVQAGTTGTSTAGKTAIFFGDSFTAGSNASVTYKRWTSLLCAQMGWTEVNYAIGGTVLEAQSENLANNMVSRMGSIPTYNSSTHSYLFICYGINDDIFNYSDFTPTNFTSDYQTILNYANSTKGWPFNKIVLVSPGYHGSSWYQSYFGNPVSNPTRSAAFIAATASVAASNGCKYADVSAPFVTIGGSTSSLTYQYISSDNLHPNDAGHQIIANTVANAVYDGVVFGNQKLPVNGNAEFNSIKFKSDTLIAPNVFALLGRDTSGNVGNVSVLPNGIRAQQFNFDGLKQWGYFPVTIPTAITNADVVLKSDSRIIGAHPNGYYTTWVPMENGTGKSIWKNNYTTGNIYEWWVGTTPSLAFAINFNKQLVGTGALPPNSNPGIWQQYNAQYGAATSSTAGWYTPFYADGTYGDGMSAITNNYSAGRLITSMSNGISGSVVNMEHLLYNGHAIFQTGGTFKDNPVVRFQVNSTTEGFQGVPRMSTTQINAMAYVTGIIMTGGSGYVTGDHINLTGGGGSGAVASVTASGGSITSATIITQGSGYWGLPTGFTVATGSGSGGSITTYTTTISGNSSYNSAEGLLAYDNTTHSYKFADGSLLQTVISDSATQTITNKDLTSTTNTFPSFVGNYKHNISTPSTGGTVNLINNQYNIINPSGSLVALTVNLPSSPANNDVVYIKYTQSITTVTYGNGTVVDGITAPTAGGLVVLTYDSGTSSWY